MEFGAGGRKRGRPENDNGGSKKFKQGDVDSEPELPPPPPPPDRTAPARAARAHRLDPPRPARANRGGRPPRHLFHTSGCPFGESCHFLHYVPLGIKVVSQMLGSNPALTAASRNTAVPPSFPDGSAPPAVKTRLCNKFSSPEGCKYGRMAGRMEPPSQGLGAVASFGASATAKISIDASLAGVIIGKNGVNSKHICRVTGAKFSIRDNESDPSSKNIELEGTFDQIKQASSMVRELILNVSSSSGTSKKNHAMGGLRSANNLKTKHCENFSKGSCTFGDRCHFAHGAEELHKPGI
ncbi:hypothetical protein V6N13_098785 [Hibiscus sabdariffa]